MQAKKNYSYRQKIILKNLTQTVFVVEFSLIT